MTTRKERKEALPWIAIGKTARETTLRNAYDEHVKPLNVCSLKTFRVWCSSRGVHSRTVNRASSRYSQYDDDVIVSMKADNASAKEIAKVLGRSPEAVSARAVALSVKTKRNVIVLGQAKKLDEVDWSRVITWMRTLGKSKTQARDFFAKGVALTMFIERLKSVTECNTARITLDSFMPACSASGIYRR